MTSPAVVSGHSKFVNLYMHVVCITSRRCVYSMRRGEESIESYVTVKWGVVNLTLYGDRFVWASLHSTPYHVGVSHSQQALDHSNIWCIFVVCVPVREF